MARRCTICDHPDRVAIDKALVGDEGGYRKISARFGLSSSALYRHRHNHLPEIVAQGLAATLERVGAQVGKPSASELHAQEIAHHHRAVEAQAEGRALDVVQQLRAINAACLEVLKEARAGNKPGLLLRAVDRIAKQIEIQAKLLGQIDERATINIAVLPEWHGIRQVVLEALRPYPEARLAVAEALRERLP